MFSKKKYYFVFLFCTIVVFLFLFFLFKKNNNFELKNIESYKIYDENNILLYDIKWQLWRKYNYKSIWDVPAFIKELLLNQEDKNFYKHKWISFSSIIRAFVYNIKIWKITQWASTIDQQVIKLSEKAYNRTFYQKVKENFLARFVLDVKYSKNTIFLYYINNLQFLNWISGFRTACNVYYWNDCNELNKWHIIYLYLIAKYWKIKDFSIIAKKISDNMWLDYSINDFKEIYNNIQFNMNKKTPFYVDYIKKRWILSESSFFNYKLYNDVQSVLNTVENNLHKKWINDACVLVLDEKKHIKTMNLLRKYWSKEFWYVNWCLSKRQVWSSMKPFLYVYGFYKLWFKKNDIISDESINFDSEFGVYKPKNFDLKCHWDVKVKEALWSSLNIPAVKILYKVGLSNYWNFLQEVADLVGVDNVFSDDYKKYWLSLALWTKEISPLDFSKMWTIFQLDKKKYLTQKERLFLEKYWKSINKVRDILSHNENRLLSFDIDNWLNVFWFFWKSWTSRRFVDWWVCWWNLNYDTKNYIICVWAWNYDWSPAKVSWVNSAGMVWNLITEKI